MTRSCTIEAGSSAAQPMLDDLLAQIRRGSFRAGDQIGTEVGLAQRHGISRMTVRRALKPWVERGIVERRPGKGLFVGSAAVTPVIEVVVPSFDHEQWIQVWRGIRDCETDQRVQLQAYDAHGSLNRDIDHVRRLPDTRVAGAIIGNIPHVRFAEAIYGLKRVHFPFVLVDAPLQDLQVASVHADHYAGGYRIGTELVRIGHQWIAFIGNLHYYTTRLRSDGLRDAVLDKQLPVDRSLTVDLGIQDPLGDWGPAIHAAVKSLMAKEVPPTAIVFNDDVTAVTGYHELKSLGFRVPTDVSIAAFGGEPAAGLIDPPLSTMDLENQTVGCEAMRMLMSILLRVEGKAPPAEQKVVESTWVPRGSLAPAPG